MTDKELVLHVLRDHEPHLLDEFEMHAQLRGKRRITVHSRVADLRVDGWDIERTQIGGNSAYQLKGRKEGPVRVREKIQQPVQGYTFDSIADSELSTRNGWVCQIVRRASATEASENEVLDYGPAFMVAFGDGEQITAYASELSPWYPT